MARSREDNSGIDPPSAGFWANPSVSELADAQGVGPVVDLDDLRFGCDDISEEELDAFFAAIGAAAT